MATSVNMTLSQRFQAAFEEASQATGTNFDYLLHTAKRESGFNSAAKAPTSSATGLFQFVEQTWLETLKESGAQYGYGEQAAKITQVGDKYYVKDRDARQEILDLRKDPEAAALMAGVYASKNEATLAERLNRTPTSGELYAAHFLGAQGGGKLIELAENQPDLDAYKAFPEQAQANRSIFFESTGEPKSVSDVYDNLVSTVPHKERSLSNLFGLGKLFSFRKSDAASQEQTKTSQIATQQTLDSVSVLQQANGAQSQKESSELAAKAVPLVAATVDLVGDGGETTKQADAQKIEGLFEQAAIPSRYASAYSPQMGDVDSRSSRFAALDDIPFVAANAGRSSRYGQTQSEMVAPGEKSEARASDDVSSTDASLSALPRAKPVTGDVYAQGLGDMLPRAKPERAEANEQGSQVAKSQSDAAQSNAGAQPMDISNVSNRGETRRFGAMDLTAFLDRDAFSASRKT